MNDWLKTLAPLLGTALGGPLGGAAAAFLADKLGIETKTVEAVTEVLNSGKMSPDQITSIKLAELDFKKFTETNKIDVMKLESADRDSARTMQTTIRSHVPAALTFLITIGFFGVLVAMFQFPDIGESAPVMIMLGSLGTAWTGACAFWFGTTNSSAQKNQMLANAAAK
jgi:gas vesicle protein